ncbi:MAG TPA: hypothetical protein VH744_03115 [Terriglobales bacterium]
MVNRRPTSSTPEPILQLQRPLEDFRSRQPARTKLPEALWQAAVELARQSGIYPVAHPLRLDYMGLKKRLGEVRPPHRRKAAPPAFIEVVAAQPAAQEACVIEFESARGAKMRIPWKASTPPDGTNRLHAWRETKE